MKTINFSYLNYYGIMSEDLCDWCRKYKLFPHVDYISHSTDLYQHGVGHVKIIVPEEYVTLLLLEFPISECTCGEYNGNI
jgi:ribosomal protein S19